MERNTGNEIALNLIIPIPHGAEHWVRNHINLHHLATTSTRTLATKSHQPSSSRYHKHRNTGNEITSTFIIPLPQAPEHWQRNHINLHHPATTSTGTLATKSHQPSSSRYHKDRNTGSEITSTFIIPLPQAPEHWQRNHINPHHPATTSTGTLATKSHQPSSSRYHKHRNTGNEITSTLIIPLPQAPEHWQRNHINLHHPATTSTGTLATKSHQPSSSRYHKHRNTGNEITSTLIIPLPQAPEHWQRNHINPHHPATTRTGILATKSHQPSLSRYHKHRNTGNEITLNLIIPLPQAPEHWQRNHINPHHPATTRTGILATKSHQPSSSRYHKHRNTGNEITSTFIIPLPQGLEYWGLNHINQHHILLPHRPEHWQRNHNNPHPPATTRSGTLATKSY